MAVCCAAAALLIAAPARAQSVAPAQAQAAAQAEPAEIVVTGSRQKCRVELADRALSDREFRAHAKDWAQGRRVRVIAPASTDKQCMIKIMFRLADRGVRLVEFVDRPDPR
ncbi:MAG: hypothetical protein JWM75_1809 [Sphingomonas bacterium]|nr:hypothetical protein [Sphingomonas bacterium]